MTDEFEKELSFFTYTPAALDRATTMKITHVPSGVSIQGKNRSTDKLRERLIPVLKRKVDQYYAQNSGVYPVAVHDGGLPGVLPSGEDTDEAVFIKVIPSVSERITDGYIQVESTSSNESSSGSESSPQVSCDASVSSD